MTALLIIAISFVLLLIAWVSIYEVDVEYLEESNSISIKYWNWNKRKRCEILLWI